MKAILEFDLPADEYEHKCAIFGVRIAGEVNNLHQQVRSLRKHGHSFATPDEVLEFVFQNLSSITSIIQDDI